MDGERRRRKRTDPRDAPAYPVVDAARYVGISPSTLHSWARGRKDWRPLAPGGPLFVVAQPNPPTLSFFNLVEAYVLAAMRRRHGVPMQRVRKALRYVSRELGVKRPLINQIFFTDGIDLFVKRLGGMISASEGGQALLPGLQDHLEQIHYDHEGLAERLSLGTEKDKNLVTVDPLVCFGRPVIRGTRVPIDELADYVRAGDRAEDVAAAFELEDQVVQGALELLGQGSVAA